MHILIVEGECTLCEIIVWSLHRLAYSVDFCFDGDEALSLLESECFNLIILGLNLPGTGGMTVLRALRTHNRDTRVLTLSVWNEVSDKVVRLNAGASDYLAKPFHSAELETRIRSLILGQFTQQDVLLYLGKLSFDTRARRANADGQSLSLAKKELGALEYLLLHRGHPVSQEGLLDHVQDSNADHFSNSIRVHIPILRKRLRAAPGYDPATNRIGEGYVFMEVVE